MQNTSSLLLSTGSPKKTGAVSSIKIYLHDHMSKSSIYLQKAKKEITSWLIGGHGAIPELRIYHEP